jgi:hypothetical protein
MRSKVQIVAMNSGCLELDEGSKHWKMEFPPSPSLADSEDEDGIWTL